MTRYRSTASKRTRPVAQLLIAAMTAAVIVNGLGLERGSQWGRGVAPASLKAASHPAQPKAS